MPDWNLESFPCKAPLETLWELTSFPNSPLNAKIVAENKISKEDRIIGMMNRIMIKLNRLLLGLLEGRKATMNR